MAIKTPDVGMIVLENPSPQVNANTAVVLLSSKTSASGAIKGIVTAAWPEPDGIKKLSVLWKTSMPWAAKTLWKFFKTDAAEYIIVSRI